MELVEKAFADLREKFGSKIGIVYHAYDMSIQKQFRYTVDLRINYKYIVCPVIVRSKFRSKKNEANACFSKIADNMQAINTEIAIESKLVEFYKQVYIDNNGLTKKGKAEREGLTQNFLSEVEPLILKVINSVEKRINEFEIFYGIRRKELNRLVKEIMMGWLNVKAD